MSREVQSLSAKMKVQKVYAYLDSYIFYFPLAKAGSLVSFRGGKSQIILNVSPLLVFNQPFSKVLRGNALDPGVLLSARHLPA